MNSGRKREANFVRTLLEESLERSSKGSIGDGWGSFKILDVIYLYWVVEQCARAFDVQGEKCPGCAIDFMKV